MDSPSSNKRRKIVREILALAGPELAGAALLCLGLGAIYWPLAPIALGALVLVNCRLARRSPPA